MKFDAVDGIVACGFEGGLTIRNLQSTCAAIPKKRGVYVVVRDSPSPPLFHPVSTGAHLKQRDPSVSIEILEERWAHNAVVLYIGKAGGEKQKTNLQGRIRSYVEYGQNKPRRHWGGRYIWQLVDFQELRVFWRVCESAEPSGVESALIREFEEIYNALPFANLRR